MRNMGGFVTDTTKDPWNFLGDMHAYFVDDHGTDVLGGARPDLKPPDEFRGRAYIEHQNFLPDNWQTQIRLGWVSDANFMTQWFPDEFNNGLPLNESLYLKRQEDSEVFTLLGTWQPNNIVTTADSVQEQREVERLPEVGYDRIGDSFADDKLTFMSDNSFAGLQFDRSGATLAQQGYSAAIQPGLPAYAYTGDPTDVTWRGDAREEIDWPINAGPLKVVPYIFGRYTSYSQGVVPPTVMPVTRSVPTTVDIAGAQNRLMAGAGARITTSFWKVDDSAESDLFDIHRLRHIIEPELDLFTSAQNIDQNRLFIYDPAVDAINDVQAIQLAVRQIWQTKRGGRGGGAALMFLHSMCMRICLRISRRRSFEIRRIFGDCIFRRCRKRACREIASMRTRFGESAIRRRCFRICRRILITAGWRRRQLDWRCSAMSGCRISLGCDISVN